MIELLENFGRWLFVVVFGLFVLAAVLCLMHNRRNI